MHRVLHIGLSYNCNMCCKHCFVKKKKDTLNLSDIKNAIDWLCEKGLFIVYYTFGEPLLADSFDDVSRYVSEKGLVQILMTNGSVIDEKRIELLKRNKITNVYISIDHYIADLHDQNRNYDGAFEKALKAIKLCKSYGINVGIATTVTKNNVYNLREIYELAQETGVNMISFLRERNNNHISYLSSDEFSSYKEFFYFCIKQNVINVKFHDLALKNVLKEWYDNFKIDKSIYDKYYHMNSCHSQNTVSISPEGEISHCNLIYNPFGSIKNLTVKELHQQFDKELSDENIVCCSTLPQ